MVKKQRSSSLNANFTSTYVMRDTMRPCALTGLGPRGCGLRHHGKGVSRHFVSRKAGTAQGTRHHLTSSLSTGINMLPPNGSDDFDLKLNLRIRKRTSIWLVLVVLLLLLISSPFLQRLIEKYAAGVG